MGDVDIMLICVVTLSGSLRELKGKKHRKDCVCYKKF